MKKFILVLIALILLGCLGVGGYYLWSSGLLGFRSSVGEETSTGLEEPTSQPQPEIVEVTIEADEYSFSPSTITVLKGARVRLTLENKGSVSHNYVVNELNLDTGLVAPGSSQTVEFEAPRDDLPAILTYQSYCSVPGHKEAGMIGTINIQ